jgi:hypothetical protein
VVDLPIYLLFFVSLDETLVYTEEEFRVSEGLLVVVMIKTYFFTSEPKVVKFKFSFEIFKINCIRLRRCEV